MDLKEIKQEAATTSRLFSKASRMKIPLSGTFELSPLCNFDCKMCYVKKTQREIEKHGRVQMSKEQWLQIAKEAYEEGMLYLLLTGGEPFLWPHFWELYEELSKMGFVISINTNGSLLDDSSIERLKMNPPSRLNITLYGASDQTYKALCGSGKVYSKVDYAITSLKSAGIEVKLNCSLTPYNAQDLEDIVKYAEDRELILSVNTYMFPPIRRDINSVGKNDRFTPQESVEYNLKRYRLQYGDEIYKQFLEKVKKGSIPPPGLDENCVDPTDGKIRCRAGKASFWITWDGWMTPCGMMPEPKIDITNRKFSKAWEELTKISEEIKLSGVCAKCPNQELCHSCAAMAMAETGSTQGIPQYLCQTVRTLQKHAEESFDKIVK